MIDERVGTLCAAFSATAASRGAATALRTPGDGRRISWSEYERRAHRIAAGLHALGVRHGDTVGLMMVNRPEFHLCDTAAMLLGATTFSVYNTAAPNQVAQVLADAGPRVLFGETRFVPVLHATGTAAPVVCVDGAAPDTLALPAVAELGDPGFDMAAAAAAVRPDDVLVLSYTSGSTGAPKGVEVTHRGMLAHIRGIDAIGFRYRPDDRCVSYLPMAHLGDRGNSHYSGMVHGFELTCVPDMRTLNQVWPDARPTVWIGVPRMLEKARAVISTRLAAEPDPARRAAAAALAVGLRAVAARQDAAWGRGPGPDAELLIQLARADEQVWAKVRREAGLDRVRLSFVGAAPATVDVLEYFAAIGVPVAEVWGMSELSGTATMNPPDRIRMGTVGLPLPGLEVRLAADGELLCRGDQVMRGYRGDPARTVETIDADGWLHSGDIAEIDDAGYVRIVERKKDLIINAAGKNMSPVNIESTLKTAGPLVGQAVVIGDRRPYNVALLVLDPDAAAGFAAAEGLADTSPDALAADPTVRAAVARGVDAANARLSRAEQIKTFAVLGEDWEAGGDELTATLKLRRSPIAAKYAELIDELYAPPAGRPR